MATWVKTSKAGVQAPWASRVLIKGRISLLLATVLFWVVGFDIVRPATAVEKLQTLLRGGSVGYGVQATPNPQEASSSLKYR